MLDFTDEEINEMAEGKPWEVLMLVPGRLTPEQLDGCVKKSLVLRLSMCPIYYPPNK